MNREMLCIRVYSPIYLNLRWRSLDWNQNRGTYHAFISLGAMCQTAHQLNRLKLRKFSGPLDWFISFSSPKLSQLLNARFNGFMELNHLRLINIVDNHYVLRDMKYQIDSYHDFPIPYNPNQLYPQFKDKLDRRVSSVITSYSIHYTKLYEILIYRNMMVSIGAGKSGNSQHVRSLLSLHAAVRWSRSMA